MKQLKSRLLNQTQWMFPTLWLLPVTVAAPATETPPPAGLEGASSLTTSGCFQNFAPVSTLTVGVKVEASWRISPPAGCWAADQQELVPRWASRWRRVGYRSFCASASQHIVKDTTSKSFKSLNK